MAPEAEERGRQIKAADRDRERELRHAELQQRMDTKGRISQIQLRTYFLYDIMQHQKTRKNPDAYTIAVYVPYVPVYKRE